MIGWLYYFAKEYRPRHHHIHVDEAEHLHPLHHSREFGAFVAAASYGWKDGIGSLCDSRHMGIDIAGAPGRIAVEIRFGSNYGFGRAYFIDRTCLASDDGRFFYFACNPAVEVAVFYRLNAL